jgi:aminopeptidase-like protein
MRTPHGEYPEYHTSADNLNYVQPEYLVESFNIYARVLTVLENNRRYINLNPKCEPQLGKRGLYDSVGGSKKARERQLAMLWILNLSDGKHSLLDIIEKSGFEFSLIEEAAGMLKNANLLKRLSD